MKPAAFLDRDGTVIELVHHLTDPADLRLIPGAATAIARLNMAGVKVVIVTNQSVIGRGMLTEVGLETIHAELARQLGSEGAMIDGIYHAPQAPGTADPTKVEHPDRKPGPGMIERAARDLRLDLSRSVMVGDTVSDLLAGRNAGVAATVLVRTGYGATYAHDPKHADIDVLDLGAAIDPILTLTANEDIT